jgi:hypothetical protein
MNGLHDGWLGRKSGCDEMEMESWGGTPSKLRGRQEECLMTIKQEGGIFFCRKSDTPLLLVILRLKFLGVYWE